MSIQNAAGLLDAVKAKLELKNDAALSRKLDVAPPNLSKIRNGHNAVGDSLILRLVEDSIMTLAEIRQFVPRPV